MSEADRTWAEFVSEVERLANAPEYNYQAILVVGMRVRQVGDAVRVALSNGASPPAIRGAHGAPLTREQLHDWRNGMLAEAAAALDRVVDSLLEARELRASGLLQ